MTNRDPYPYVVMVYDRDNSELIAAREGERISGNGWVTFWDASNEYLVFSPRPGYSQFSADYV